MTRHLAAVVGLLLTTTVFAPEALAQQGPPPVEDTKAKTRVTFLGDSTSAAPGSSVRLGLRFRPEPEWHLYWQNPGDTGLPTEVTVEGPNGVTFSEVAWPAPSRFVDKVGGVSYGYDGEVLAVVEARIPEDFRNVPGEGAPLAFEAKARWLACKENCIQGSVRLGLTLPLKDVPPAERMGPEHAAFEASAVLVPVALPSGWSVTLAEPTAPVKSGTKFELKLSVRGPPGETLYPFAEAAASFIPRTSKGLIVRGVTARSEPDGSLLLTLSGEATAETTALTDRLDGVLRVISLRQLRTFDMVVTVPRAPADPAAVPAQAPTTTKAAEPPAGVSGEADTAAICAAAGTGGGEGPEETVSSLLMALLFAFLGGLILNAMPCVLPVLSIKILSLVEQSREDPKVIWRHGLAYTAGVLASFGLLSAILVALQATNWAFQMQDPVFVAVFTAIVFAFALSLFGVFELSLPFAERVDAAVAGSHGYVSSFNYGIFAVLLGTPCTAPFLGPAMTYAFTQPPLELTVLMLTVGLGLASPFLVLARFPAWRRFMPKPGPWLLTFKKAMAFLLVGTAIFLLHTLASQVSREALVGYIVFIGFLSFALWVYGHWTEPGRGPKTRAAATISAIATVGLSAHGFVSTEPPPAPAGLVEHGGIAWRDFDQTDVEALARDGHTVFIDFTAEWCTTCKVNEQTAIYTDDARAALAALKVTAVRGDFTIEKPAIATWLKRFNQPSVPLYVVIPAKRPEAAFALPTLLSTADVVSGLCRAGASTATL